VEIIAGTLSVAAIIAVHLTAGLTLERIFVILFIAPAATALFMSPRLDFAKILPLRAERGCIRELAGHIKWTMLGGTALYLFNWGDNFVLRYSVTLSDIGVYNLAYQAFKGVSILSGVVRIYFLPFLAQHSGDAARIGAFLSHKRLRIMAAGSLCIALFMAAVPFVLPMVFGEAYRGAVPVALVLLIGSFFMLYRYFYEVLLNARRNYRFTQLATACFVVMNLALDVALVPPMGIMGAAVATTVTYISYALAYEIYFRREMKSAPSIPVP
jgi:O-antigen/teichoic acid export membrane protein